VGNSKVALCIGPKNSAKIRGVTEAFSKFYIIRAIKAKSVKTSILP
jgi:non-canonical (house-cleaning) NTP pyrophosphatase